MAFEQADGGVCRQTPEQAIQEKVYAELAKLMHTTPTDAMRQHEADSRDLEKKGYLPNLNIHEVSNNARHKGK